MRSRGGKGKREGQAEEGPTRPTVSSQAPRKERQEVAQLQAKDEKD